jgi:anti-sigma-K factor RskA
MNDVERYQRAGDYVFGLMDSVERERAERDLERDVEFRLAVSALTARVRAADREIAARIRRDAGWEAIAARLAALPQMRGKLDADAPQPSEKSPPDAGKDARARSLLPAAIAAVFAFGLAGGFLAGQYWAHAHPTVSEVHAGW